MTSPRCPPVTGVVQDVVGARIPRTRGVAIRRLFGCILALVCAVTPLGVGSFPPRRVFSDEGIGCYASEKGAFARFALV